MKKTNPFHIYFQNEKMKKILCRPDYCDRVSDRCFPTCDAFLQPPEEKYVDEPSPKAVCISAKKFF